MASETQDHRGERGPSRVVRNAVDKRTFGRFLAGIGVGVTLALFTMEAVPVPVVGPVSGWLLGVFGILAIGVTIHQTGLADVSAITGGCNCSGECGDSCSYQPD